MRFFDINSQGLVDVSRDFLSHAGELTRMGTELAVIQGNLDGMTGMDDVCNTIAMEIEKVRQIADHVEGYGYAARNIADNYEDTELWLIRIAENMNRWEG